MAASYDSGFSEMVAIISKFVGTLVGAAVVAGKLTYGLEVKIE